ncbi:MAG TPA: iron ABC transporter substrate-binding protein [Geminicoccaceae bacterium]|nr:iron ABC transporter substrate-binding protein [Geminicoccaceae bacterium]
MRSLVCALAALLALAHGAAAERTVTDSAGRQVAVPDRIERVFAAGPPASILLYILAPDRMIGWPRAPHPEELPYIAPEYRDLPEVGWLTGRGDTVNLEILLQSKPDLIFDFGSVRDTYVSLAERVQAQTGIPYILIDGTFANTAAAVRLLGTVLGVEERAERIAAYVEATFSQIDRALAAVPQEERPRVYLARGPSGLETGLQGSINTEIIERVGGVNVAVDPSGVRRGIVQVPIEQVVVWNPDTVITWDRTFYESVWTDFYWQGVDAVAKERVYLSPTAPFGWIDRPPSLNRMIGLKWLAGLFYPEHVNQDLREVTRSFYDLFYHVDLTDAELDRLLRWAEGRAP